MSGFDIAGKVALITGGNTGIGKRTATVLAQRGAKVYLTSRDEARGRAALADVRKASGSDDVELLPLDLGSFASIRAAAAEFLAREQRLHVLVNNAGVVYFGERRLTADGFEEMFGVNHLGHFLLTGLLLDTVKASAPARIVNLSSAGYRMAADGLAWDDLQGESDFQGFPRYGHSKLANIYFTTALAKRLEGSDVTVNAVHPGHVVTELGRPRTETPSAERPNERGASGGPPDLSHLPPPLSVEDGSLTSLHVACSPEVEGVTGQYFVLCEPVDPGPVASDPEAAERLWKVSEQLVAGVPA